MVLFLAFRYNNQVLVFLNPDHKKGVTKEDEEWRRKMGYTLAYNGSSDTPLTQEQRAIVAANVEEWSVQLSENCEAYEWEYAEEGCELSGLTKPSYDDDEMDSDMDVILSAVRALQKSLPNIRFTVTDDFDMELFP